MSVTERVGRALTGSMFPDDSRSEKPFRTLITDEPWDRYHLQSLLPLKETYRETAKFGFLLRHYWIPATVLTFRQSSRMTFPDGRTSWAEQRIERSMARCRSNECLWRERVWWIPDGDGKVPSYDTLSPHSEMLCSYDCYEQTFHSAKPILFAPPTPDERTEARRQGLYRLPMLCPPGPVPIGFSWYAKVDDDYMNYRLDAEERLGETSVLVVRREGCYTTWVSGGSLPLARGSPTEPPIEGTGGGANAIRVVTERKGITLFAWNRGTVLEDRFEDRVVGADGYLAATPGAMSQVVTRLIRSCPEELAAPATKLPQNQETAPCRECKPKAEG